ncbi:LAMI_0A05886g1_1 [Lachancea mirantina]|uniref:CDP-diacylglycerol--glycerol-3-phosphate 3-phosphatidyltransferase n=1 Tax=Lachancea mirantina TaxID=1230905 RepID=A0A1G4IQ18_9SACH|nr:LAMI_0A05886g1_1 [Lachancea mirantina]
MLRNLTSLRSCLNNPLKVISVPQSRDLCSTMSSEKSKKISESFVNRVKSRLSSFNPQFLFKRGEIDVLHSPEKFYETIKSKIASAEDRIFLASLYVGTSEEELIDCLSSALSRNKKLKAYFLLDGLRGTRESPKACSASLLSRLVDEHGDRVDFRLYRTPALTRLKEALIPRRFNEGIGLQHMKIYGFDDEVILSGANLSKDYFTNRQDRYYCFKSKSFADYFFMLHQLVSGVSYKVAFSSSEKRYKTLWPSSNLAPEPNSDQSAFYRECSRLLSDFLDKAKGDEMIESGSSLYPTSVFPISQFTPLFEKRKDLSTEKRSILTVLSEMKDQSINWTFTAGYFNMLPSIKTLLLRSPSEFGKVITASPHANGFFESKGVSKHLPNAYLYLCQKFLKDVEKSGKNKHIDVFEWKKGIVNKPGGWSYHAKGIWLSESDLDDTRPALTIIGSSNYTRRAYSLDLESNALIITNDSDLRGKMQDEIDNIMTYASKVTLEDFKTEEERRISTGVKMATSLLGKRL